MNIREQSRTIDDDDSGLMPPKIEQIDRAIDVNNSSSRNPNHGGGSPLRRSKRDTNSIKLRGTATTFYRRMQILFFDESSHEEEYEEVFRSSRASRGRLSSKRKRALKCSNINGTMCDTAGDNNAITVSHDTCTSKLHDGICIDPGGSSCISLAAESLSLDGADANPSDRRALPLQPTIEDIRMWLEHRKGEWLKQRGVSLLSTTEPLPQRPTKQELEMWLINRKKEWKRSSKARKCNNSDDDGRLVSQRSSTSTSDALRPTPFSMKTEGNSKAEQLDRSDPSVIVASSSSKDGEDVELTDCIMSVKRVTEPDDAAIYVIENFLTESDLLYFDEKIRGKTLRFEKSFVDNQGVVDHVNRSEDYVEVQGEDDGDENLDKHGNSYSNTEFEGSKDDNDVALQNEGGFNQGERDNKPPTRCKSRIVIDSTQRTSMFVSFRKMQDSKIASIEQRIADIFGCFSFQIEALQMVRYSPGQFFGVHHDMGEIDGDDVAITPPKNIFVKRRLVTMFIYLNTLEPDQGGATYFPKCNNLRVRPVRGRAVVWSNVTSDGKADTRTIHAGEPVLSTNLKKKAGDFISRKNQNNADLNKYGINVWICEE